MGLRRLLMLPVLGLTTSPAPHGIDPYPYLHGGVWGPAIASSPDPTANYTWNVSDLEDPMQYQCIHDRPVSIVAEPESSFLGFDTLTSGAPNVTIVDSGVLRLEFSQNGACWFELDSPDLTSADGLTFGISESDMPAPQMGNKVPKQHGKTWRHEPNKQFYDGVRFAWINVTQSPSQSWRISGLRRVCQVVPTNYKGRFESSDPSLDRIWYTGAYTVKVTINGNGEPGKACPPGQTGTKTPGCGGFLGSELLDRGDRIAFLGDAHAAQAAALVAFDNWGVLASSNNYTKSIGNTIQPYWVMWVNSVIDYFDATGDEQLVRELVPWVTKRLDHAQVLYQQALVESAGLRWSRDDDRMGFGFEFPDLPEAQRAFCALTIEACSRWSGVMRRLGNETGARAYGNVANGYLADLRKSTEWWKGWGMHASADMINTRMLTSEEVDAIVKRSLSDPLQLPSLSNFESHFILRALGRANASDLALGLVRRHWAYVTDLGATTTWERFDPEWHDVGALHYNGPPANSMNDRTSMAHPWAAGATTYLSEYGLGIRPMSPGFEFWRAMPQLMGSAADGRLEFVRGAVPVPGGAAGIEMDLRTGICQVTVPPGTRAEVGLPKLTTGLKKIFLQAIPGSELDEPELLWANKSTNVDEASFAARRGFRTSLDGHFLMVTGLEAPKDSPPLVFRFSFQHFGNELVGGAGARREVPSGEALPVRFLGLDDSTAGKWVGTYGNSGYSLFNYTANGKEDLVRLPIWAAGIWSASFERSDDGGFPQGNFREACGTPWNPDLAAASDTTMAGRVGPYQCVWTWPDLLGDPRVPVPPTGIARGQASAVRAKHWGGSFHVDVELNATGTAPSHVDVALYLVDYQDWSASAVVKVLDLDSKRLIGPMSRVSPDAYKKGSYVRYRYPMGGRGLRFRIEQVHSKVGDRHSVRSLGYPPQTMATAVFLDAVDTVVV